MNTHWADKFISQDPDMGNWTCWDYEGEYIGTAHTIEEARRIIEAFAEELEERSNDRTDA